MKTITDSIGNHVIPHSPHPQLTQFPAYDFVNPGLAQISRLYSFYVPLFSKPSSHLIIKATTLDEVQQLGNGVSTKAEQLGKGVAAVTQPPSIESAPQPGSPRPRSPIKVGVLKETDSSQPSSNSLSNLPAKSGIQDSFLHPKFNFGTINFENSQETIDSATLLPLPQKRKLSTAKNIVSKKHKFNVY
jgi:hypothetical protein